MKLVLVRILDRSVCRPTDRDWSDSWSILFAYLFLALTVAEIRPTSITGRLDLSFRPVSTLGHVHILDIITISTL
jgi:hypothetical protein